MITLIFLCADLLMCKCADYFSLLIIINVIARREADSVSRATKQPHAIQRRLAKFAIASFPVCRQAGSQQSVSPFTFNLSPPQQIPPSSNPPKTRGMISLPPYNLQLQFPGSAVPAAQVPSPYGDRHRCSRISFQG
jgi:hypothetical protein